MANQFCWNCAARSPKIRTMSALRFLLIATAIGVLAEARAESEAELKAPVDFVLEKDGKIIGKTQVMAGTTVRVLELSGSRALIGYGGAKSVWVEREQLQMMSGAAVSPDAEAEISDPNPDDETQYQAAAAFLSGAAAAATAGLTATRGKLSELFAGKAAEERPAFIRPVGRPTMKLWADPGKKTPGLTGTYFDRKLGGSSEDDLTRVAEGTSRVDKTIEFGPKDWGSRRQMGISGGKRSRWENFTVQWDGWIELNGPGRLSLRTNGGSRMWIDADGNDELADKAGEFTSDSWGSKRRSRAFSAMLPAGLHRVRIQYEGGNKENWAKLEVTDGFLDYRSFFKDDLRRFPWEGRNIVLLTKSADHDPEVVGAIVEQFDEVFDYFVRVTGRKPRVQRILNGKTTVAEVPNLGKALARGYVGATGVEMRESAFRGYLEIQQKGGAPRSLMKWEFGRNFFFYEDQMRFKSPDSIGYRNAFAIVMRTTCFRDLGLPMQRFMIKVCEAQDRQIDTYVSDASLTFENTLRVNTDAFRKEGKGEELLAAMIVRLHRDYGGEEFITRFWQAMAKQPKAKSTQDAVENLLRAACIGARQNLTNLFGETWKMPVSDAMAEAMAAAYGAPI
jgi:hypothetical protein